MEIIVKPALNAEGSWHIHLTFNGIHVATLSYSQFGTLEQVKDYALAVVKLNAFMDVNKIVIERW